MRPIKIAVDVMGSDKGPSLIIEGALESVKNHNINVILIGDKTVIENELNKYIKKVDMKLVDVIHASQVIEMHEAPISSYKNKKDSSILIANKFLSDGLADAFVSAGNTGAVVTSALLTNGKIEGVDRPAIAVFLPSVNGKNVMLDVGANVDSRPKHLLQFAMMGVVYAQEMLGVKDPKVGLLSIGEEEIKGNEVVREAYKLFKSSELNFIGNIEGRDLLSDKVDVIVCDGFIGNIVLKFGESLSVLFYKGIKNKLKGRSIFRHIGALLAKPVVKDFLKQADFEEYGAAPLLGVNKPCFISHGNSPKKAISNAVKTANSFVKQDIIKKIKEKIHLSNMSII